MSLIDAETCSAVKRARKVLETSSSNTMSEVEVEFDICSRIPERNHVIGKMCSKGPWQVTMVKMMKMMNMMTDDDDDDDDDDDEEEEEEEDEEGEHSIWKQTGSVKSKPVKCLFTYPTDAPLLVINWVTTPLKGL